MKKERKEETEKRNQKERAKNLISSLNFCCILSHSTFKVIEKVPLSIAKHFIFSFVFGKQDCVFLFNKMFFRPPTLH